MLLAHGLAAAQQAAPARAAEPNAIPSAAGENAEIAGLDLDWEDTGRKRAVPVRLYLPEGASAARPVPLVVFSHGMGGSRRGYSYLGRYWASQGYASLHLQHIGSDRSVWTGNIFSTVGRLQGAAQDEEAIARVGDFRFALDQLLAHPELGPKVDASRIAAAGHSYGATRRCLLSVPGSSATAG